MTTNVQTFLRGRGATLAELATLYGIKATRGKKYPNLVSLKYSQIDSPMDVPLVQECRGIVLDEADDWRCVARGFDKFFNYGEPLAAEIDWATARVQEKIDGSLCMAYWYDGDWRVATSGSPDASGSVGENAEMTFADLFWQTFHANGLWFESAARIYTVVFELCAPENRIVVHHREQSLTLLTIRDPETGREIQPGDIDQIVSELPYVREFPLAGFADIHDSFAAMNPLRQEGYVVVDGHWNRVKVKHPTYVALHHLKDSMTTRALMTVVRSGEVPELITAFPELAERVDAMRGPYEELCAEVESDYTRLRAIPEQKAFAVEATQTRCPAALFSLRSGKVPTAKAFFAGYEIDKLLRLIGLRESVPA